MILNQATQPKKVMYKPFSSGASSPGMIIGNKQISFLPSQTGELSLIIRSGLYVLCYHFSPVSKSKRQNF